MAAKSFGRSAAAMAAMAFARGSLSPGASARTRPKSRSTGTAPAGAPGSRRTRKFPGCGSAWKKPSRKIIMPKASTMASSSSRGSTPCFARSPASAKVRRGRPSMNSMVSTLRSQSPGCARGTATALPKRSSAPRTRSSASRSARKSSSLGCVSASSRSRGRRSKLGSRSATRLAMMPSVARSSLMRRSTPSCCTFTATTSPLCSTALCTCAMEAEPMAGVAKSLKASSRGRPRPALSTRRTSGMGLSGMRSVSRANSRT
mmetsp:Transcript_69299/g.223986  ORF Transcript_69299/g.223986 Transcript_69299/m.223986 type:complete len:260 (-) Transcript_69299:450-1229(-)